MKILSEKNLVVVGALLLLTIAQIHAAAQKGLTKQAESSNGKPVNDLDFRGLKKFLDMIPIVGPIADNVFNSIANLYQSMDNTTNGLISRILDGMMPCKLSDYTLRCSAVGDNGGTFENVQTAINLVPDLFLSKDVKSTLLSILKIVINPLTDSMGQTSRSS